MDVMDVKTCLSQQWDMLGDNNTQGASSHCPPAWDGFSCWAPTRAGATATSLCPSFKGSDITKYAFRVCHDTGKWVDKEGAPSSNGWTNYTPCLTPEILEIMRRLGTDDDARTKINIAANTRILEFVGLSLSLAALLLSLLIFYYFRTLRNSRTRLHRHLFIALVIQVAIRLAVYTDQLITRSKDFDANGTKLENTRRGIDNTPILCEASYISLEYARTAMFMWMFVEGLFLHNMITVTVFEKRLSPIVYPMVGWIIPIPLTVAWAVVTHWQYGHSTCWWGYNFTGYFWILEGPRLAVLVVNFAFLLNILRVLVTKLRQSNSSETQQALKAVKAALVFLPLLGLTNLLNMLDAPLEKSPFQFALWSYTTHLLTSTQGFILAFLYCFRNGEVQMAVRKFLRTRVFGNSKHFILAKKPIPMSALDNPSIFHPDSGGVSRIPSMNMNQSQRSMHTTIQSSHPHHLHLQHQGKAKSSPPPPPPLMVRTYCNGVIKQTTLRVGVVSNRNNNNSNSSPNPNDHHHHNENLYDNGTRPLLYKRNDESVATTTTIAASSPVIKPMTSSSGLANNSHQQPPAASSSPAAASGEVSARRIRIAQLSNWRMFIIPEMLQRKSTKQNQEITRGDDKVDVVSPSTSCSQEKEERLEEEVSNENDVVKGGHSIIIEEDKGMTLAMAPCETDSLNHHVDVDVDDDDFVTIEISPGNSGGSIISPLKTLNHVSISPSSRSLRLVEKDDTEIDLDNEETQQLSMEIDIVVE